jgi:hypothetical protein
MRLEGIFESYSPHLLERTQCGSLGTLVAVSPVMACCQDDDIS